MTPEEKKQVIQDITEMISIACAKYPPYGNESQINIIGCLADRRIEIELGNHDN